MLYWHVNKLRENSQSELVPVKDRKRATISEKERVKKKWAEQFENVVNRDRGTGKNIEENEKNYGTLDAKEDRVFEEELVTVLKELKNNKAPGADNDFFKYGSCEFRN